MLSYSARRLLHAVPLLIGVATVMFILVRLAPGDAVSVMIGDYPASPEYVAEIEARYGLDRNIFIQYLEFMKSLAMADLGHSFARGQSVSSLIVDRVGNTLVLTVTAALLAAVVGMAMGILAGVSRKPWLDHAVMSTSIAAFSVPVFWLAQILLIVFALNLGWFPVSGMTSVRASHEGMDFFADVSWHLVLPVLALAFRDVGTTSRITRTSVRETLSSNYVLTALSKGIERDVIVRRHVIRNAMLPVVTVIGYNFGTVLAGSVLVESVFGWPGLGRLLFDSIGARDNAVIIGIVLVVSVTVVVVNILTDLVYAWLDPRIRL